MAKYSRYCMECLGEIDGEHICPHCGAEIIYANDLNNQEKQINLNSNQVSNFEKVGRSLESFSDKGMKVADSAQKIGGCMTLGCTIPILIVLAILFFL
ncbi:hypothetical protein [Carnobacterium maltaromaticum]|uniref:hypothetical protein n=1 Tax=Carnobacterium maltaromaticum TaxID=2751 RepID=UPI0039BEACFD